MLLGVVGREVEQAAKHPAFQVVVGDPVGLRDGRAVRIRCPCHSATVPQWLSAAVPQCRSAFGATVVVQCETLELPTDSLLDRGEARSGRTHRPKRPRSSKCSAGRTSSHCDRNPKGFVSGWPAVREGENAVSTVGTHRKSEESSHVWLVFPLPSWPRHCLWLVFPLPSWPRHSLCLVFPLLSWLTLPLACVCPHCLRCQDTLLRTLTQRPEGWR